MKYRNLGNTGVQVSEIGLGGEWLLGKPYEEVRDIILRSEALGVNILDCWMSDPDVRDSIGKAIAGRRERWHIQGHVGSVWKDGQYARSRDIPEVKAAFEDLLARLQTDYIDFGMIHFVDEMADFERVAQGDFMRCMLDLKARGAIRHIGLSTHNPAVARAAALQGDIQVIMFSVNPAFDMLPASENIDDNFVEHFADELSGITPERAALYQLCERRGVGVTVMKAYAGGRLFNAQASPFGVALTPVQCLHYALTRPAVASVMVGFSQLSHVDDAVAYETADEAQRDYATPLANAPAHSYRGQCTYCGHCSPCAAGIDIAMMNKVYDLALMQPDAPDTLRAHYQAMDANAGDCVRCGACETRCPFGVKVIQRMEQAKALFEG